jgi:hypothetical protein
MNNLILESSYKTPEIRFDPTRGSLLMKGRVFPENPGEFFQPVLGWLNAYTPLPGVKTELILFLDYFNSASYEYIFRCCKIMEALGNQGKPASIVWEYESDDEDMQQMGQDVSELLKINFELRSVS